MEEEKIPMGQKQLQRWPLLKMVEIGKITLKEAAYNTIKSRRKEVSMEPPQYEWGLLGLQKREYLANRKPLKRIRKCLYLIFKPSVFGLRKTQRL